ncbi:hypothetical protein AAG906_012276 [Vitis piasezkii]
MMDLDMALREDEPPKPTNESTEAMRAYYAKWERSNRLSLISIKRSIVEHLLREIPESNNVKEFLVVVGNRYQTSDNAETGYFMDELMNMRYNDMKRKKVEKTRKPNFHNHKKMKNFKKSGNLKCYHCNKKGHKRVDCFKFKNWLEKKKKEHGMLSAYVCFESNLVNVPLDSWWLDSGATVHVATSLQRIRNLRKPSEKESKLKVGSDIGIDVEHIGIVVLKLDYGFQLVLDNVFCVPSFRRNLIFLSVLDKAGYSFTFANKRVEVIYDSKVIGNCVLSNGLYRLSLLSTCSYNVENSVAKRPLTKERSSLLWHKRLRHISKERVECLISSRILSHLDSDDLEICVDCVKGKLTKTKKNGAIRNQNLLEIVHTNISGPYSTTLCGNKYFITFIDDFSRYGYVYLIKEKMMLLKCSKSSESS